MYIYRVKKIIRKILRISIRSLLVLIISVVVILAGILIAIQTPGGQHVLKQEMVSYLKKHLNTNLSIGRLRVIYPSTIILEDVYVEDLRQDTLMFVRKLDVRLDMRLLLEQRVVVHSLKLKGVVANLITDTTGVVNYQFIADAFPAKDDVAPSDSIPWRVHLHKLLFSDISLRMEDHTALPREGGFDPKYLHIHDFNMALSDFFMGGDTLSAKISQLSLREKSGLQIKQFTGSILLSDTQFSLREMVLTTPYSRIENTSHAQFLSLASIADKPDEVELQLFMKNSFISSRDLQLLLPEMDVAQLPEELSLAFLFSGTLQRFIVNLDVKSDMAGASIFADISDANPSALNGTVAVNNLFYKSDSLNVSLDKINFSAWSDSQNHKFLLNLPFAEVELSGNLALTELGNIANDIMARFFAVGTASDTVDSSRHLALRIDILQTDDLKAWLPDSLFFDPISLNLNYAATQQQLVLNARMPMLQLGTTILRNADLHIQNENQRLLYDVGVHELAIDDFSFKQIALGGQLNLDTLDFRLALPDTVNQELNRISGRLMIADLLQQDDRSLDVELRIEHLALKSLAVFVKDHLSDLEGYLTGTITTNDVMDNLRYSGALRLNNVGFRVTELNAFFHGMNDTILFNNDGIVLDQFSIYDMNNEMLKVRGQILMSNPENIQLDLMVSTDDFQVMNSTETPEALFFGDVYINLQLLLKGSISSPDITGRLRLNELTDFTLVVPQTNPAINERAGIVEFVNPGQPKHEQVREEMIPPANIVGLLLSMDVEIDKDAAFTIIVDKVTGDVVRLKGDALLNAAIDPSGKITLTGRYEFYEGVYEMNMSLFKRNFELRPGSSLIWTGDPLMATLDMKAVHITHTAPFTLVESWIMGMSPAQRNRYLQRLPFGTELILRGDMLKPEVSFDIVLEDEEHRVAPEIIHLTNSRLAELRSDPTEMNKQVFSLLLFNRFIGENPFASTEGVSSGAFIRESAGRILADQLNMLASDLLSGVDMEFQLSSRDDYTTGQQEVRTDLNLGLSKRLFDNRLKITVGSRIGLDSSEPEEQRTSHLAGDASADYLITRDGRYRLRAFRKHNNQITLYGEVIETGVTFVYTTDF